MITRKDYMDGKATFEAYYGEIAEACDVRFTDERDIARFREALKTDEHMNNIPLGWWDARATGLVQRVQAALKARDDFYSMAVGVCILKTAARKAARELI
jgi:hypothetical protein